MIGQKSSWMGRSRQMNQRYLKEKLLHELPRYTRDMWEEFEPEDVLHRVGLATYRPTRMVVGGMGAFLLGVVVGGIAAMLLTPKSGTEMRVNMKDKAKGYLGKQGMGLTPENTASA